LRASSAHAPPPKMLLDGRLAHILPPPCWCCGWGSEEEEEEKTEERPCLAWRCLRAFSASSDAIRPSLASLAAAPSFMHGPVWLFLTLMALSGRFSMLEENTEEEWFLV